MYMICHKSKSIFVHIPKTGGTSIEHSLGYVKLKKYNSGQVEIAKHIPDHRNSQDYFNLNAVQFWRYHKFTVVRDPIERELSLYRFVVKNFAKKTLDSYLDSVVNEDDFYRKRTIDHKHFFSCQTDFILINEQICLDQIIRFEDLQNGFNLLCNNINIKEQNLLQLRKTLKKRITEPTSAQIQKIRKIREKDFDLLGY